MSNDIKNTDESLSQENTEESLTTEELVAEIPADVESDQTPEKDLDFGELMPTGKRSAETRGGLSRKEHARLKEEETQPEVADFSDDELASIKAEHRQLLDQAKQFAAVDEDRFVKQMFNDSFQNKGINAEYFNEHLKDSFTNRYSELTSKGLSKVDAGKIALDLVMAGVNKEQAVKEAEDRAQGRLRAKLPPSSTREARKVSYKASQLQKLGQADYDNVMDLRDQGKVTIVEDL